jgi:hypothetical protein
LLLLAANYDPEEDEYFRKNGHVINGGETLDNNNRPITVQPSRLQRNGSTNRYNIEFVGGFFVHKKSLKRF